MHQATLYLKDGESHAVCTPALRDFQEIVHYIRVPADAAGQTLHLRLVAGGMIDIPAAQIASMALPPPHVLTRNFMTDAERAQIWDFALAHREGFEISGAYNDQAPGDTTPRRHSRILDGPANQAMAALVFPKLQKLLPNIWSQLRMAPTPLGRLECQVTAHGDGDFFALHTDNGAPDIAYRQVSYVFYFYREPKQFSGGHLRLYDTRVEAGFAQCGALAADIEPPNNSLIVFPAYIHHEVTPICCTSAALADQRLTLNGWLFAG